MRKSISLVITFILVCASLFSFAENASIKSIYLGNPSFEKLSPNVANTRLFDGSPKVNVHNLLLASTGAAHGQHYSYYHIHPTLTKKNQALYWTKEHVTPGDRFPGIEHGTEAFVHGRGLSFGGIFWPLEKMTVHNQQGQEVYYNKIDISAISPISGHLFPLAVGNDLKFHFTRYHVRYMGNKSTFEKDVGIMEYKVTKEFNHYPYSKNPVPGPIYTIEVWESTNHHPKYYLTDIYDYAPKLGWYINDTYFNQNNKKIAIYRLQSWD